MPDRNSLMQGRLQAHCVRRNVSEHALQLAASCTCRMTHRQNVPRTEWCQHKHCTAAAVYWRKHCSSLLQLLLTLLPLMSMRTKLGTTYLLNTEQAPVAEPGLISSRPSMRSACTWHVVCEVLQELETQRYRCTLRTGEASPGCHCTLYAACRLFQ